MEKVSVLPFHLEEEPHGPGCQRGRWEQGEEPGSLWALAMFLPGWPTFHVLV